MSRTIAILEDDPRRIEAMRTCLAQTLPAAACVFFDNAADMIDWLRDHLHDVALICLDHDLPLRRVGEQLIDCGTGRQIVDFLTTLPPACPVLVHSSNHPAAGGMIFALQDAGWTCDHIHPCDDLAWIATAWQPEVQRRLSAR